LGKDSLIGEVTGYWDNADFYPRQVEIVCELPRNEAGEILRGELRARENDE
jgi:acyl-coenzyme A synthetase/AMP-(fatty) acid ligase